MLPMELISNIAGYLGTAAAIVGFQVKKRESLLASQIASNLLVSLSFLLLGKVTGGLICFIATGHTIMNYILTRRDKNPTWWENALFLSLYVAASVYSWVTAELFRFPVDVFPLICAILFFFAVTLTRGRTIRLCFLANAILWILYDLLGAEIAVANLITHVLVCTSNVISIVRYDLIKRKDGSA